MELMKFNLADVNASLLHWSIKVVTHAPTIQNTAGHSGL
jgi:hypothetical protein